MFYLEDNKSQQLYNMNKRRCMAERCVYRDGDSYKWKIFSKVNSIFDAVKKRTRNKYYDKIESSVSEYTPLKKYVYSKIPKTVIYTAILGKYDILHEPFYTCEYYDFVLITDDVMMGNNKTSWKIMHIDKIRNKIPKNLNAVQLNRWLKMHPHEIFPEYEVSIYIDGSVNVVADMMPIILSFYESKKIFGIHLHAQRTKIDTELNMLLYCNKINRNEMERAKEQIIGYKKDGFDDSVELLEATVLIRRHNDILCKRLMELWWNEFINGVQRDQISLPYVIWSMGLSIDDIYILGDNEYINPRFYISSHR